LSYDEKPGVQAIGTTAPDLPAAPSRHASLARDHEYVRHGTLSLLAGIDLLTGVVLVVVEDEIDRGWRRIGGVELFVASMRPRRVRLGCLQIEAPGPIAKGELQ